jgi:hypothetical protein
VIEVELELPASADVDRAAAALRAIRDVESVEPPPGGSGRWRIHVRPAGAEAVVRQEILMAAVSQRLHLTALRPVVPSLDEIYRVAVERPIVKRPGVKRRGARSASERRPR